MVIGSVCSKITTGFGAVRPIRRISITMAETIRILVVKESGPFKNCGTSTIPTIRFLKMAHMGQKLRHGWKLRRLKALIRQYRRNLPVEIIRAKQAVTYLVLVGPAPSRALFFDHGGLNPRLTHAKSLP